MASVEIRDIGTTVRQVIAEDAPALASPELMQVVIGINRQVEVKESAGQYSNQEVDILLANLLATSELEEGTVDVFIVNEFGEFEIPESSDITDLVSFKVSTTNTAVTLPAYLRVKRTSQAVHATGSVSVSDTTVVSASVASAVCTLAALEITVTGADFVTDGVLAGDVLELVDVNNSDALRRFRVTADAAAATVLALEDLDPDGLGTDLAAGTHENIRVFRPVYTLSDTVAKFIDYKTRPMDDGLAAGSKMYPQPGDTITNPATFSGLYAFAQYEPLVGTALIWRIKTWTSNTSVILDPMPSGGTGPQWVGAPLTGITSVRYWVQTEEPAIGRVPTALADIKQSYQALRKDLVGVPTKVQGTAESLSIFGPAVAENPLGLAMFMAATISPNQQVMGVAVETDDAVGHGVALDALTTEEEPYDLVPLSTSASIISLYQAHVNAVSAPEERKERTLTFSLPIPTRQVKVNLGDAVTIDVTSGSPSKVSIAGASFLTNGVGPGDIIELKDSGHSLALRQFTITFVVSDSEVEVAALNPDTLGDLADGDHDAVLIATKEFTAQEKVDILVATAEAYKDRRLTLVLPDKIYVAPSGSEIEVSGAFAASNVAALYAINEPGAPMSLAPVPGISRISGSNDTFTNAQLKELTSAGIMMLVQTSPLVSPIIRFEASTDVSNKKVQQRSYTRVVDALAKALRNTLNAILGRERMTDEFLNKANVAISAVLESFLEKGRITDFAIEDFGISSSDATALAVVITASIPNVGNNIDITLVV